MVFLYQILSFKARTILLIPHIYNEYMFSPKINFSIKRMLTSSVKVLLAICCLGFAREAKAENNPAITLTEQAVGFRKTVEEINDGMFDLYAPTYKAPKNSAMANRKYAPAYRLRETPYFVVKTNILHDLTSSINVGVEMRLEQKVTLDLPVTYNPWTYNRQENSKFKFILFQPELRFWTCEAFDGHFFGLHGQYAYYNVGRLSQPPFSDTMNQYRFEGQLAGAGVSYGYVWPISARWGLEAEIGVGYARLWYDKYPCQSCAKLLSCETKNYWGITRAGISLIYYIF